MLSSADVIKSVTDMYLKANTMESVALDALRQRDDRIKELEAIESDHQNTVAQLLADKATLVAELTKAQALAKSYQRQLYSPTHEHQQHCVHGVPLKDHWMHRTTKPEDK